MVHDRTGLCTMVLLRRRSHLYWQALEQGSPFPAARPGCHLMPSAQPLDRLIAAGLRVADGPRVQRRGQPCRRCWVVVPKLLGLWPTKVFAAFLLEIRRARGALRTAARRCLKRRRKCTESMSA